MKDIAIFFIVPFVSIFLWSSTSCSQIAYTTHNGQASFFSEAPVSNISARSEAVIASFNPATNKVRAEVSIKSFQFPRSLMQQHFNDRYMHSKQFPNAVFEGFLNTAFRTDSIARYQQVAEGMLIIHGVAKARKLPVILRVKSDGTIAAEAKFTVRLKDHDIETPTLLFKEITDSIDLSITLTLVPSKIQF
jgi:polyisoprenoid-binding protein YceI